MALCLFLVELLKFEITSTKTIAALCVILSSHPVSNLKKVLRQKCYFILTFPEKSNYSWIKLYGIKLFKTIAVLYLKS